MAFLQHSVPCMLDLCFFHQLKKVGWAGHGGGVGVSYGILNATMYTGQHVQCNHLGVLYGTALITSNGMTLVHREDGLVHRSSHIHACSSVHSPGKMGHSNASLIEDG